MMVAVALVFTAGVTLAQDDAVKKQEPAKQTEMKAKPATAATYTAEPAKCDNKNCCMMKDGKMVSMKEGKESPMTADVKLSNGSVVTPDGTLIMKDGTKRKLKNNECLDNHGKMCTMPEEKHDHHDQHDHHNH